MLPKLIGCRSANGAGRGSTAACTPGTKYALMCATSRMSALPSSATLITRLIIIGVAASSFSLSPFSLIQAAGRPSWTGTLHLVEMPIYIVFLVVAVKFAGVTGAAAMWTGRALVDAAALFLMWERVRREPRGSVLAGGTA